VIGALRHWALTGKRRDPAVVEGKRRQAVRTLDILEAQLAARPFVAGNDYTIADMSVFAYAARAEEAGLSLASHPAMRAWIARVQAQPRHLAEVTPYSVDPHSVRELA
jgi:glutathione S-transferase